MHSKELQVGDLWKSGTERQPSWGLILRTDDFGFHVFEIGKNKTWSMAHRGQIAGSIYRDGAMIWKRPLTFFKFPL